jgi:hypothetical protein
MTTYPTTDESLVPAPELHELAVLRRTVQDYHYALTNVGKVLAASRHGKECVEVRYLTAILIAE